MRLEQAGENKFKAILDEIAQQYNVGQMQDDNITSQFLWNQHKQLKLVTNEMLR